MERVVINTKDLLNNIEIVKNTVKNNSRKKTPKIIGVVKANGYGLGIIELSNILIENGIDILGVSKIEEGVKLRKDNIRNEIILLLPTCIEDEIIEAIENDITLTVGNIESLILYNKNAKKLNKMINIHLMIETGFGRTGIKYNEIEEFISEYKNCDNIDIYGMFTHFNSSFLDRRKNVDKQYMKFIKIVNKFKEKYIMPKMLHICNSSAVFKYPEYYLDAVRVGSAFVGKLSTNSNYKLKPIGQLETCISDIQNMSRGESIGYGARYITKKNIKTALIQTGYSSGTGLQVYNNNNRFLDKLRNTYHDFKSLIKSPKSCVLINDRNYEIISGIRMNDIIINITNSNIKSGDKVIMKVNPILVDTSIKRKYI